MSTFADMTSRIADDINRSDLTTQIGLAINRAIDFYAKKYRFWFNEATATFNTVASQVNYTSTDTSITRIREIDFVKITINSSNTYELRPVTYMELQRDYSNTTITGQPMEYAYYKENFYLYDPPDAAYTITVSYVKDYADLSGSQDNDFTTNAEDLIEARASWWVYTRLVKDYDAAAIAKQEEKEALESLIKETNRVKATGRTVATCF